jgi:ribonuclease R
MVPITAMTDDYYLHDSRRYRLIGETSNRMYQLGDRVAVRLEQVDLLSKRINFSLIGKAPLDPLKKDEASGA